MTLSLGSATPSPCLAGADGGDAGAADTAGEKAPAASAPAATKSSGDLPAVQTAAPLSPGAPAREHRVQMRLSGSNCIACLMELEKKLKGMSGVTRVKIERPDEASAFYFGGPGASWSEATIIYNPDTAPLQQVMSLMRSQGYHPWKVQDRVLK